LKVKRRQSWSGVIVADSGLRTTRFDINAEGRVIVERVKRGVDPQLAVEKTLRFLQEGQARSTDGTDLDFSAHTHALRGDSPNGREVVKAIRDALDAAGLQGTVPSANGAAAADQRGQAGT
jgi:hypothetical protein